MTRKGFTLIESMIYTIIFVFLVVAVIGVAIPLTTDSQAISEKSIMISESTVVINRVNRIIGSGATFNSGASSLGQTLSRLVFTDNAGDTITLRVTNGVLEHGVNSSYTSMHSDDIAVQTFYLERINTFSDEEIFRINYEFANDFGSTFGVTTSVNFLYD